MQDGFLIHRPESAEDRGLSYAVIIAMTLAGIVWITGTAFMDRPAWLAMLAAAAAAVLLSLLKDGRIRRILLLAAGAASATAAREKSRVNARRSANTFFIFMSSNLNFKCPHGIRILNEFILLLSVINVKSACCYASGFVNYNKNNAETL